MRTKGVASVKTREPDGKAPSIAAVVPGGEQTAAEWLVRGADGTRPNRTERFSGTDALLRSLTFAHDEYSRVRWLMN